MTEAEIINEQAIVDAEAEFQSIDRYLEKIKTKVANLEFPQSDSFYVISSVFATGFIVGTKVPVPLRGLSRFLAGAGLGYFGAKMIRDIIRENKELKTPTQSTSTVTHEITVIDPEQKTELHNVKVIE